jgi:signal peptidase I
MTDQVPVSGPACDAPDEVGDHCLNPNELSANHLAWRLLLPLTVALIGIVLVFYVFFNHSIVSGTSMVPTLQNAEYLLTTKGLAEPKRGDVVVLNVSENGKRTEWVKRIVGLAGDRIHVEGDFVLVNGAPESFPHEINAFSRTDPTLDLVVPAGDIYVMGDNRPVSLDSRYVGPFPVSSISGKVVAVFAPIERMRLIPEP